MDGGVRRYIGVVATLFGVGLFFGFDPPGYPNLSRRRDSSFRARLRRLSWNWFLLLALFPPAFRDYGKSATIKRIKTAEASSKPSLYNGIAWIFSKRAFEFCGRSMPRHVCQIASAGARKALKSAGDNFGPVPFRLPR